MSKESHEHVHASLSPEATPLADKGLKQGALGLISSTVVGVASTAPAYSLAATLGFVVVAIGLQAPIVTVLAFVPMLLISFAYKEMNNADPDCGTTFTWAARAFGPKTGWMGGWGIVAADILVMASLAQVAGQYVFLLFNANGIGHERQPAAGCCWSGILWIVVMTYICYLGIEISANFQKALLGIELTMLMVLSVVALVKVGNGSAPVGPPHPVSWSWFNPFDIAGRPSAFIDGARADAVHLLGLGHHGVGQRGDGGLPANARARPPCSRRSCSWSPTCSSSSRPQSYAGLGTKGIGLGNPANESDVLSVLGHSIFGTLRLRQRSCTTCCC